MADSVVIVSEKSKAEEIYNGAELVGYDMDQYFAKVRPDRQSQCSWTQDLCPNDSPHLHNDNM